MFMRDVLLNKFNRAKLEKDDVAPQSKYVGLTDIGLCSWVPFFSWSVSHCSIDSTWFPFDEHSCSLIYQSWKYGSEQLNFTSDSYEYEDVDQIDYYDLSPNAVWDVVGKRLLQRIQHYSVMIC